FRVDVHEEHAVARIDHREIAQVKRAASPVEQEPLAVGGAAEEAFDREHAAGGIGRANEAFEADAKRLAHAVDRLEPRGEDRVVPTQRRDFAARAQQRLGGPRERTVRASRNRAALRDLRVDPIPHGNPGPFAGLMPAWGYCAGPGLRRGYPS